MRRYGIRIIKLRLENMRIIYISPLIFVLFLLGFCQYPCPHIIYSDLNDNICTECFLTQHFITLGQTNVKNNDKNVAYQREEI